MKSVGEIKTTLGIKGSFPVVVILAIFLLSYVVCFSMLTSSFGHTFKVQVKDENQDMSTKDRNLLRMLTIFMTPISLAVIFLCSTSFFRAFFDADSKFKKYVYAVLVILALIQYTFHAMFITIAWSDKPKNFNHTTREMFKWYWPMSLLILGLGLWSFASYWKNGAQLSEKLRGKLDKAMEFKNKKTREEIESLQKQLKECKLRKDSEMRARRSKQEEIDEMNRKQQEAEKEKFDSLKRKEAENKQKEKKELDELRRLATRQTGTTRSPSLARTTQRLQPGQ